MRNLTSLVCVALLAVSMGCIKGQKVAQGKVVSYDVDKKVLVLEDDKAPSSTLALDVASAEVASPKPAPGGVVRVAYHDQGGTLVAGRVMTVGGQKKAPAH